MPSPAGHLIQVDSITIFSEGIKNYLVNAIDVVSKFGFTYKYDNLNSYNAKDFIEKVRKVFPFKIRRIQTDNGSEFHGHFLKYARDQDIIHYFNYPHHPQSNGCVERFNRTIKEQFINNAKNDIKNSEEFNKELMEYLVWYNTEKPHSSINNMTPIDYLIYSNKLNAFKSNML